MGTSSALWYLFTSFLLRLALRRPVPAAVVYVALYAVQWGLTFRSPFTIGAVVVLNVLFVTLLIRYGVLALAVAGVVGVLLLSVLPLTPRSSAWFAASGWVWTAGCAGLAVFGFYTTTGARLFKEGFFSDD